MRVLELAINTDLLPARTFSPACFMAVVVVVVMSLEQWLSYGYFPAFAA